MDPFARKMVVGSFVYGGMMVLMFAVLTVIYLHTRPQCSDRFVAESTDPGKNWTATIMERRCGAEAPFFTHVNLRPAGQDLKTGFFSGRADDGEIFVIEDDAAGAGMALRWNDDGKLVVDCPRCSLSAIQKHEDHWSSVTVNYNLPQR